VAKRTRRTRKSTDKADRGVLRARAGIWLATVSTVVGVATGMFTLRDQVFPREAGTARAVSAPAYQQDIGRICDEVNDNDRRRARDDKRVRGELRRAKTTIAQRNALLDGVRRTATRSGHTLASFTALDPPPTFVAARRETEAAWNRNLARLRGYAERLDRAATRAHLDRAVEHLSKLRTPLARDGDRVRSGLQRLGAADCDLEPPIVPRTYTLPALERDKKDRPHTIDMPPSDDAPGESPPPAEPDAGEIAPQVNPPPQPAPEPGAGLPPTPANPAPGANTPPVTGGGED
jgi:hypothetical protein